MIGKVDDIKNFLRASAFPAESVTVNIVHADGQNTSGDIDLADPANYLKYCKIEAVVPDSVTSQCPVHWIAFKAWRNRFCFEWAKYDLSRSSFENSSVVRLARIPMQHSRCPRTLHGAESRGAS